MKPSVLQDYLVPIGMEAFFEKILAFYEESQFFEVKGLQSVNFRPYNQIFSNFQAAILKMNSLRRALAMGAIGMLKVRTSQTLLLHPFFALVKVNLPSFFLPRWSFCAIFARYKINTRI